MDCLLLRLDAPLMSFGGVMVDQHGPTERYPGVSLLAGLLGNALGYRHADAEALLALQARIEYAARWDIPPQPFRDYHTVDLGQPKMREPGWTTRGEPEHRKGGPDARFGTHQRYRHYWANGVMTVALGLTATGEPGVERVAAALHSPARPLFLGRKTCLPAASIFLAKVRAPDVLAALTAAPRAIRPGQPARDTMEACWPVHLQSDFVGGEVAVWDQRDWRNQVHVGRRLRREGLIRVKETAS